MATKIYSPTETHRRKLMYFWIHMFELLLSLFLIIDISVDTFKNIAFYREPQFIQIDFWICILFLADFFLELILAEKKWRYLATHFLFFLVAIPYNVIIDYFGWTFPPKVEYLIRYIPLVRGGYALAMVVNWLTLNKATGLFLSYLISLAATLYFSSVVFFIFEQDVNPLVNTYGNALWWAAMDMTTVGSNIIAVTPVGMALSVLLAALGMMLFPIFTVYVTNLIQGQQQKGWVMGEGNFQEEPVTMVSTDSAAAPAAMPSAMVDDTDTEKAISANISNAGKPGSEVSMSDSSSDNA